jgi:hypothetical protein
LQEWKDRQSYSTAAPELRQKYDDLCLKARIQQLEKDLGIIAQPPQQASQSTTMPQHNREMNSIQSTPQPAAQVTTYRDQMNHFRNNPMLCQVGTHENKDSDFESEEEVIQETQV